MSKLRPPFVVDNHLKAQSLLRRLAVAPNLFGIDTETIGINPEVESPVGRGHIFCWSIAWYDPKYNDPERAYISGDLLSLFAHWLADPGVQKVGHNVFSFDLHMFANHGIPLGGLVGDTLRMSKLAFNHPDARHGLKPLSSAILGIEMDSYQALFSRPARCMTKYAEKCKHTKRKGIPTLVGTEYSTFSHTTTELIPLDELPELYPERMETLYEYASLDAYATLLLYDHFKKKLGGRSRFYNSVWNPSLYVLTEMEGNGWAFDSEVCTSGVVECEAELRPLDERLLKHVGWRIPNRLPNWNSTDDRVYLLYGEIPKGIPAHIRPLKPLGAPVSPVCGSLKALKKTRRGKTPTDAAALTWLAQKMGGTNGEFCKDLLRYRQICGDISKYKLFPKHLRADGNGAQRIVYCLKPSTDTGRLAASNAPIQQVPKVSKIREAFIARPGHKLIVADYSALEVRMLAHFLIDWFDDDTLAKDLLAEDFHQATADRHGVSREYAKAVNYSVNYDKSAMGLGLQLGIGKAAAQDLLDNHNVVYPAIQKLKSLLESRTLKLGYVETLLGGRRYIPELRSSDDWEYGRGYRKLTSTLIQGSSADFVTMAMLHTNTNPRPELADRGFFNEELYECKVKQIAQVHDEIVFEVPEEFAERAALEVERAMSTAMKLHVPFPVNVQVADNWLEGK